MELSRILIRELNDMQVIELREVVRRGGGAGGGGGGGGGEAVPEPRRFPIVIGLPEAQAIERRLAGVTIARPQTHDLLASVIESLGAELERVEIPELKEGTFFARLRVRKADGQVVEIDARPSDAIALGIAGRVPIWVAEEVIEGAQRGDVAGMQAGEDEDDDEDGGFGLVDDDDEDTP
jgi:hypothetical protein